MHAGSGAGRWFVVVAALSFVAFLAMAGASRADAVPVTLTVNTTGNGAGYVLSAPAGIDCGNNVPGRTACSAGIEQDTEVTLTANTGANFLGFSGGCTTTALQCTFTLDEAKTVTANFGKYNPGVSVVTNDSFLGNTISAQGAIQGGLWPKTGNIQFRLYGPDDATCSGPSIFSSQLAVSGSQQVYLSGNFTPTQPGTYRWTASYSGDDANNPGSSACNSSNSIATVAKASTSVANNASDTTIGGTISNTATLSGGQSPTGSLTMRLYLPADTDCSGSPVHTTTATVSGNGPYVSDTVTPTQVGTYRWVSTYSGDVNNSAFVSPCSSSVARSIVSAQVVGLAIASTDANFGSQISTTVTLSQGQNPSGTLFVSAYGPGDTDCSGSPVQSSSFGVTGNGQYLTIPFTPTQAGVYRWTSSYSGDATNAPATTACGITGATSTVAKGSPALSSPTATGITIGSDLPVQTTLSAGSASTGTISFAAYGPDDATCSDTPAYTSSPLPVSGNGNYGVSDFAPTEAGAYRWIASYSGDTNYEAETTGCSAASNVDKESPATTIEATGANIGQPVSASASITGGFAPTGTITFTAFGPDDQDCSGPSAFTASVSVNGNGEYQSGDFTPSRAGTYRWVAAYPGDTNNEAAATTCADVDGRSIVAKAGPTLTPDASGDVRLGDPVTAGATIAGGSQPSGTVTFTLFGPDDQTCSGSPVFSDTVPVSGNGRVGSSEFRPEKVGTYRWVAEYSGDGNNEPATVDCASGLTVKVSPLTCPAVSVKASRYKPAVIVKEQMVRGVRARVKVSRPSSLAITASLKYRLNGKQKTANLGKRWASIQNEMNLRLALPGKIRKKLPWGAKATLILRTTATPDDPKGCTSPPTVQTRVKVRIVHVLKAPQVS